MIPDDDVDALTLTREAWETREELLRRLAALHHEYMRLTHALARYQFPRQRVAASS
jgi:hypothetical protein